MTPRAIIATLGLVFLTGVALCAEPGSPAKPAGAADELALRFDFESDLNQRGFPDEWRPVGGTRHPQNVRERLDPSEHHSGERSFLVEPDGFSTVYETERAFAPDPRLSWRLTGYIKTQDLPAAGPRATSAHIEVVGLTSEEKLVFLASSERVTGTADWTRVTIDIPRELARPFRLVRFRCITDGTALGGKVWFDDISFAPHASMRVTTGDSAFRMDDGEPDGYFMWDTLRLMTVRSDTLLGGPYEVSWRITNAEGQPAGRGRWTEPPGFAPRRECAMLDISAPGIYRLEVEMTRDGKPVSSVSRRLLCWPLSAGGRASGDFGVYAGGTDRLDARRARVLLRSGFGMVGLDLFGDGSAAPDAARASETLLKLHESVGAKPVVVLGAVPPALAIKLFQRKLLPDPDQATWLQVLSSAPGNWSEELLEAAKPLAGRTRYWQIGERSDRRATAPEIARAVKSLRGTLAPIIWSPRIGVVLSGKESDEILDAASACDFLVLEWSPANDGSLRETIARLRAKVAEVWVSVSAPQASENAKAGAAALAEKMLRAKAAGADRVMVRSLDDGLLDDTGGPTEALYAAVTAASSPGVAKRVDSPAGGNLPAEAAHAKSDQ